MTAARILVLLAKGAWSVYSRLNRIGQKPSFTPKWSEKPLLKSYQKTKPPLGWPRSTDSLCPRCVPEIRQQILDGKLPHEVLLNERVGEIKATIVERDGKILMVKDCPKHGHFEDVMSIDTAFTKHLEEMFPGRDIPAHADEHLHPTAHGLESTVVDARGDVPVLLRPGAVTVEIIEAVLGHPVVRATIDAERPNAPGQLASHYAPDARVRLDAKDVRDGEALLAFGADLPPAHGQVINLSPTGDLTEAAANLFAALRALDASGADTIAVMPIPDVGLGEAINDRLRRAAAPRGPAKSRSD